MFPRLTARVLLACYGVIALWGQGLHEFIDDDGCCDQEQQSTPAAVAPALLEATPTLITGHAGQFEQSLTVQSPGGGHCHDCDNCPICQFQAMGQHFVALPPADIELTKCEILPPGSVKSVHCPALFSPAQPRAPPVV
jgi:hypothetical protein